MGIVSNKNKMLEILLGTYCLALMFPTLGLLQATSIYTGETPSGISYNYRSFYFSITVIPLIIIALFRGNNALPKFKYVIAAIAIKDIIYVTTGKLPSNIPYDLSLFLVMIAGYYLCVVIFSLGDNPLISAEKFINVYMFITMMTQYVRIVLGYSTEGRYGAIGQTVGAFGFLTAIYIIFSLCIHKKISLLMPMAFLSLIMTGQRTHLFLCLFFSLLYVLYGYTFKKKDKLIMMKVRLLTAIFLFGSGAFAILLLMIVNNFDFSSLPFLDRTIDSLNVFSGGTIQKDDSIDGRFISLAAGLEVLSENPLGVSNVFYDLQYRMSQVGYPTFPHNFVLANSLLWSPIVVFYCLYWLLKIIKFFHRERDMMVLLPSYLFASSIIWGSPFADYTFLFIILFFAFYSKLYLDNLKTHKNVEMFVR